jgi:hypothetical protein
MVVSLSCFVGRVIAADADRPRRRTRNGWQALYRRLRRPQIARRSAPLGASGSADFGGFQPFPAGVRSHRSKLQSARAPSEEGTAGFRRREKHEAASRKRRHGRAVRRRKGRTGDRPARRASGGRRGRRVLQAGGGGAAVLLVDLDADVLAAELLRGEKRGARACEGVEHGALRRAERLDERL